jgi:hypothetical protein
MRPADRAIGRPWCDGGPTGCAVPPEDGPYSIPPPIMIRDPQQAWP